MTEGPRPGLMLFKGFTSFLPIQYSKLRLLRQEMRAQLSISLIQNNAWKKENGLLSDVRKTVKQEFNEFTAFVMQGWYSNEMSDAAFYNLTSLF